MNIYHLDMRLLSDIIEPGPSQSAISDHLRLDRSDHSQSSGESLYMCSGRLSHRKQ